MTRQTSSFYLALISLLLTVGASAQAGELIEGRQPETQGAGPVPVVFKVRGQGFAVKDIDGGTEVETDIWEVVEIDTRNAFNTTTKRYVVPETGYYYLHAQVDQANFQTTAFFRLRFNVDPTSRYASYVDGDDVLTSVSGIFFLTQGQEVYTLLRNFTNGDDERMDGAFSWFGGHRIY
jgi:hypothetical protein